MKKSMKNSRGITLVALVITIILLIILAGMSIQLIAGNDGLLGRASGAVDKNEIAAVKETVILYLSECKIDYMSSDQTGDFVEFLGNKIGEGKELDSYYIIIEDDEIIAYKGKTASLKNKLVTGIVNTDGTIEWIQNDNSGISIIVTPRSQTEGGVERQTVGIKVEGQDWVDWEAQYNWNGSKTQNPEEWKSLSLTGEGTLKEGSADLTAEDRGDYYLWIKITTNGQTKIKSFGPYKLGPRPKKENIICTMTSTSDNDTKGVITVGSNKVFEDWKLVYSLNSGSYEELEQGKTKTVNVVKNDLVVVKYIKDGEVDVTDSVHATELKVGYTLQYNANGGTGGPSSVTQYDNATFTIVGDVPNKSGYYFTEWNTEAAGNGTAYQAGDTITIIDTTTLYAQWEKTLSITYNANGGSGTMTKMTNIKKNTTVALSPNEFTKTGYIFKGWATSASGSVKYANGANLITGTTDITLYAVWEVWEGTLTITKFGGYTYNSTYTTSTSLVSQYLFDGVKSIKQGNYGALLLRRKSLGSDYVIFEVQQGGFVTFATGGKYSDTGGSSGANAIFYKLNTSTGKYENYTTVTQLNNNQSYGKTFFSEGKYKMTASADYVVFDEWIFTGD